MNQVICGDCKKVLDSIYANEKIDEPCPYCGSKKKTLIIRIYENLILHEAISGKVKQKGFPKPRKEFFEGDELYNDKKIWVKKTRIIDRENDKYLEEVKDSEENIIHICKEKLSQHFGHGSAKRKNIK